VLSSWACTLQSASCLASHLRRSLLDRKVSLLSGTCWTSGWRRSGLCSENGVRHGVNESTLLTHYVLFKHSRVGDIVSISAFGQVFIILNSAQAAYDLLGKKSIIYSGRPVPLFAGELCGWRDNLAFLQNTERLRRCRKWFHQFIDSSAVLQKFLPTVDEETHGFLRRVLSKPQELDTHVRQ
jgi:hypothetical protein